TVRAPLQDAGLVHIVVVSGLKVVIVIGLAAALAAVLAWSRRRTLLVIAPAVTVYVLLSGAGPAAVRSAVMAGAALLVRLRSRSTDPLPVLAVVAALMLVAAPPLAASPGYQLSFLGTAGIVCLTCPLASRPWGGCPCSWPASPARSSEGSPGWPPRCPEQRSTSATGRHRGAWPRPPGWWLRWASCGGGAAAPPRSRPPPASASPSWPAWSPPDRTACFTSPCSTSARRRRRWCRRATAGWR